MNPNETISFKHNDVEIKGVVGLNSKITNASFMRSPVDIIVPFHGQYEKVVRLIESIYRVRSNPYKLTLVDDGSPNATFLSSIKSLPQLNCIRLEKQIGFGGALRVGFEATKQPWVVFMHSDVEAQDPNWMIDLGQTLMSLKKEGVKMVSARTNNPMHEDDRLKADRVDVGNNVVLGQGDFLPFYCAMCHRDLFKNIKGFVKEYPFAMYEDQELAHRMICHGFKQAISGTSWVYHHGNVTIAEVARKNSQAVIEMENNYDRCIRDMKIYRFKK